MADPSADVGTGHGAGWLARTLALLWSPVLEARGAAVALAVRIVRIVYAVLRDLWAGHLTLRATGLVYVTILSIVPLIAISFSVLKAFGAQRQLEPLLRTWLAPLGAGGDRITSIVVGFVENAQGNVLAGVGIALLFVTTVSMAERVESSFNFVWRVDRPRNLARRLSDYLAVLLGGPVVMVTALGLLAMLENVRWLRAMGELPPVAWLAGIWVQAAPYLLVCAAFAFVYWFLPNTRVRFVAAATGGLVGGVLWAATGALFARFVVTSTQTLSIYATFAIAITALIWLHLCWLILLIGAQVAFYVQHPDYLRLGYRAHEPSSRDLEALALATMLHVGGAFTHGTLRSSPAQLAETLGLPGIVLSPVLARLESAGLLTRSEHDELLPNRDPARITLREILAAVREPRQPDEVLAVGWPSAVRQVQGRVAAAIDGTLGDETLADLVEAGRRPGGC
jgi:membrane protein